MSSKDSKGHTLPEVLISVSLALMLGAAAMTAITLIARGQLALGSYADMNAESRLIIELVGRDVRQMSQVTSAGAHVVTGLVRSADGSADEEVEYRYEPEAQSLVRSQNGNPVRTFHHIAELNFKYLDAQNEPTSVLKQIKQIQLLGTTRMKAGRDATGRVLSAQFTTRS